MGIRVLLLASLAVACRAGATPASISDDERRAIKPSVVSDVPTTPVVAEFPQDTLVSYFADGKAAKAMQYYRRQEFALADATIEQALAENTSAQARHALGVLRARVLRDQGLWEEAAIHFAQAAKDFPVVANAMHFEAARAFAKAGNANALTHANQVEPASAWGQDTEFLLAESSRVNGKSSDAITRYQRFIEAAGDSALITEARYRLGEVLASQGKVVEARATWRKVLILAPTSTQATWLRQSDASLDNALGHDELLLRGKAYFVAMRNAESAADFAAAFATGDLSAEERCQALFHKAKSIYKDRDYKRAAKGFVPAIAACKASGNTDYEVKSAYQAGLAFGRARKSLRSIEYYRHVETFPKHSYADDARLRAAEQFASLGKDTEVRELLESIPTLYPQGDMRTEAMWRLGRRAYLRKDYEAATKWLRLQISILPIETNWWAEGQAHYWLGRSLAKLGEDEQAIKAYRDCIRLYPLTYYSLQAFARLGEAWPEDHSAALREIGTGGDAAPRTLKPSALYSEQGFRTALQLARLGLGDATRRQLTAIGMGVPDGRRAETDPLLIDQIVASSRVLDLAGDYAHSHWPGRWHTVGYRRQWPAQANQHSWRLAYPLAFWELLQEFAQKYSYPKYLQMAIVREESAFDPSRESWANAIGLTQMIFPTARDHAKESGILVTRENLQHPVKNVTIGSHFLQSLQEAFEGRVGLMVPGYNAGRARVRGWIRQRHRYDLDEFIELIPGDQARRYTKRVLGSYFTYVYLGEGRVPEIRNAVPRRLSRR